VLGPVVTLPGYLVPVATVLGNYTASPARARVHFNAWCADASSKIIKFSAPAQNVTVPGDESGRWQVGRDGGLKSLQDLFELRSGHTVPPILDLHQNHRTIAMP
jgi:hypothetical protein